MIKAAAVNVALNRRTRDRVSFGRSMNMACRASFLQPATAGWLILAAGH
jgi:hypothetical protein